LNHLSSVYCDTAQQPLIWSMVHHTIYYLNHSIWKWERCFLNIFQECDDYFRHSLLPKYQTPSQILWTKNKAAISVSDITIPWENWLGDSHEK
jgi:hypothetical protein